MAKRPSVPEPDPDAYDDTDDYGEDLASVVRVGRDEDVAAICGRIDTSPTYAVVVHAPRGNRSLSTELGMRRLHRHAEEAGKMVAIASGSVALTSRARQAGIPSARRPDQIRWDAGGHRVFRFFGASIRLPSIGKYLQYVFLIAVVVGLGFGALAIGPSAKIIAYPPTETLERLVSVTASSSQEKLDSELLIVPSSSVSARSSLTLALKTTGKVNAPVRSSRVALTIANPSSADVVVPAGTILATSVEGITFALDLDTTIATKATATANATALQRGTTTNVVAGAVKTFQDERFKSLTVTNQAVASGGANEERQAVDAADIVSIRALANELEKSDTVRQALIRERPRDTVFLKTAETSVELREPSPPAGTEATILTMEIFVTVTAQAILADTLDGLARAVLITDQGSGTFIPGTVTAVETGASQVDAAKRTVRTQLRLRGEFARNVSPAIISSAVKGKSEGDVRSTLAERYGIQDSELKLTPGWSPRFPRATFRISVELKNRQAEQAGEATPPNAVTPSAGSNNASPAPRP